MKYSNWHAQFTALSLAVLMSACATQPGQEAEQQGLQQQIANAERSGGLEALFEKYAAEAGKKGLFGENKEAQAAMRETGHKLALVRREEARALLKQARLPSGQTPLAQISGAETTAARMLRWSADIHADFAKEVAAERNRTQTTLDQARATYNALEESALSARYRLLGEMAALVGTSSIEGQALLRNRELIVKESFEAGVLGLQAGKLEEADARFSAIQEVSPGYQGLDQRIAETRASQFEFLANNRRDDAGVDAAMTLFASLKQRPDFSAMKQRLSPAAQGLYQYLVAKGGAATGEDKLAEAYVWLTRARNMRSLQGGGQSLSDEEKRFAEQVFVLSEGAGKRNQSGLALGYLFVVQDVYADYPGLKRALREMQDRTLDRAIKKITAANFTGSGDSARYGGSVSSKLTQMLFRALPDDIRIVERDQLQAVMREQEIVAMQGTSNVVLSSADYLVQGSVLEASVENSEKKGKKTVRVVTRKNRVPNPQYVEWEKGQRTSPAPREFNEEPVYEDIPLNVTAHRKVGVLGVSYRIVDASNARMLFADSLTRKRAESAESSEGVQLGEFSSPMKIAELLSDSEILESLADEVASHIGKQLVEFLRDPEAKYEAAAERHKAEDNPSAATEVLANAWALAQKKGKSTDTIGKQMREQALRARPTS